MLETGLETLRILGKPAYGKPPGRRPPRLTPEYPVPVEAVARSPGKPVSSTAATGLAWSPNAEVPERPGADSPGENCVPSPPRRDLIFASHHYAYRVFGLMDHTEACANGRVLTAVCK